MLGGIFDKNKIEEKLHSFSKKIAEENFWKDKLSAQKILKEKKFFDNIFNDFDFTVRELDNLEQLLDLAENSPSDSVKLAACKDLLDRAGFRPIDRREEIRPQRTPAELEAEIKRLVGTEKAELLLGKKSVDDLVQEKVAQQEKASVVN